jgi:hypothetical protein
MGGTKAFAILIALVAGLAVTLFHYDLFTTRLRAWHCRLDGCWWLRAVRNCVWR